MGVQLPSEPINRHEQYLAKIAGQAVEVPAEPLTREEAYLDKIAKNGSGGGGGTTDYEELDNLPKVNNVELKGNKSLADLGIASASALANKVDKVEGKGLSTNDYTDDDKSIVGGVTAALATKVDKVEGKGLSSNDFTDAAKTAIESNTTAISGIKDGESINSFSGVESALSDVDDAIEAIDSKIDDTTEYPYADVITINDAVPANLADCKVKVEPVQDLHGYDKPWVGGAGTNKLPINNDVATQSDSGITWFMDNGSMSIDGTASSTVRNESGNYALAVASYVIKGTEYFKLFCGGGNFSGALGLRLYFTDNTYIEAIRTRAQDTVIIKSLSTHVGKTVKGIGYYINSGCVFDHNTYSMAIVENEDDTWTPYENICPISGHTEAVVTRDGKNLAENNLDTSSALAGVTITKNPDGSMDCNGTITNTGYTRLFNDNLNLQVGQTYTISGMASTMGMRLYFLDKDQTEISRINCYGTPVTFEVPQNTVTTKANILTGSKDSVVDVTVYPQVELGSTATPYEPYSGQQYTLALGDTIYGCTVDFDSGVMTVDRAYYTIASASDFRNNQGSFPSSAYVIDVDPVGKNNGDIISNKYEQSSGGVGVFLNSSGKVRINTNESYESKDAALSGELSGVQIVYELATPTTIQLTPQQIQLLQGTNTLYASTGDISVSVNGVSGAIGAVQEQANATDNALAQLAADIAEQLPDAPTTDGAYVLTVTVADGEATYSWESAE